MLRFFQGIRTLEELKKKYRELAMKHHPDVGGDDETMKAINREYDEVFPRVKNSHYSAKNDSYYEKETKESVEWFKDIVDKLIRMNGVISEVVGSFIWLSGDTKPYKEQIKALGFKWHSKKMMWYLPPEGYHRYGDREYSYAEVCAMYGVQKRYYGSSEERQELTA